MRSVIRVLIALTLCAVASARPDKVNCDRKVSGVDVMTKSTVMGHPPATSASQLTVNASAYGAGDRITITLNTGSLDAAFIHASAGTLTTSSSGIFSENTCATSSLWYANNGVSTHTFTWTAPSDVSSLPSVEIASMAAGGHGPPINKQIVTLTRAAGSSSPAPPPTSSPCAANHHVSSNACVACVAGTQRAAGDDPTGNDTSCVTTICSANERVASNACVACSAQETNAAGDDASGADTSCDQAPPPSSSAPAATSVCSTLFVAVVGAATM